MTEVIPLNDNMRINDNTRIDVEICAEAVRVAYFEAAKAEDPAAKAEFTRVADMWVEIGEVVKRYSPQTPQVR